MPDTLEHNILSFYECPEDCPGTCRTEGGDMESVYPFCQISEEENCVDIANCPVGLMICYDYYSFSAAHLQAQDAPASYIKRVMFECLQSNLMFIRDSKNWKPETKSGVLCTYPKVGMVYFLRKLRVMKPGSLLKTRDACKKLHEEILNKHGLNVNLAEDLDKKIEMYKEKCRVKAEKLRKD